MEESPCHKREGNSKPPKSFLNKTTEATQGDVRHIREADRRSVQPQIKVSLEASIQKHAGQSDTLLRHVLDIVAVDWIQA